MLNKIIKRGQRKLAKSDVDLASASRCRNPVGMSPSNIILNHGHRGGSPQPNLSEQQQPHSTAVVPSRPPLGTIENLPMFRDVLALERQSLFQRKVKICCHLIDFCDTMKMVREKEIKRQTLVELVDFIQSGSGKITELIQNEMVQMIALNIFRCLPPASYDNTENLDPDEEDPFLEPSWPHLQLVYELLLRYVVSTDTNTKVAKRYIDHSFILKLLDLFDSEDPREREYLKTILHRIYAKFMVHRPFIRKAMNHIFYRFIYEIERHNGIAELLEILGSIINGFALPMKEEHKLFLARVLIPLHKPKPIAIYHDKLSYCITQFVEKDYKLADMVIMGLLRYWPATNSEKEVLFLAELEEVLEVTHGREFQHRIGPLFGQIAHSICSSHFQVSERALFLWNNEHIFGMISQNRNMILPIIFEALESNIRSHWNQAVLGLTVNVRKMFLEMDVHLFNQCQMQYAENVSTSIEFKKQREVIWQRLTAAAATGG